MRAVVAFPYVKRQIELRRSFDGVPYGIHRQPIELKVALPKIVHIDKDLKDRGDCQISLWLQFLHEFFKGKFLMIVSSQRNFTNPCQKIEKTRIP